MVADAKLVGMVIPPRAQTLSSLGKNSRGTCGQANRLDG